MKKLILVRHGECDGNTEGRFRGQFDFPLNENGLKQAHETANALQKLKIDFIYSSPLKRSFQTAEIISDITGTPLEAYEAFNNLSLGPWNGRPKSEIEKEYPKEYAVWKKNPEDLRIENLENLNDVKTRAINGISKLREIHSDDTVIIVSHRAVIKPMIAGLLGLSSPWFWKLHLDNASINIFEKNINGDFMMTKFNYTEHLSHFHEEKY